MRKDARGRATVLLARIWTMQVARRMGSLAGRERRARRRIPCRDVAKRERRDPKKISTHLLLVEIVHRISIGF